MRWVHIWGAGGHANNYLKRDHQRGLEPLRILHHWGSPHYWPQSCHDLGLVSRKDILGISPRRRHALDIKGGTFAVDIDYLLLQPEQKNAEPNIIQSPSSLVNLISVRVSSLPIEMAC